MKLKIHTPDASNSTDKEFDFPVTEGDKGLQALKDLIVVYRSNARQGNAKAKTRAEVTGSGKKIYRQKGTGGARHGDRQAPIYVGGGVAHPPKLRDWTRRFNQKSRKLAFRRALTDKINEGGIELIEAFQVEQPKTRLIADLLKKIQPEGSILLVDQQFSDETALAARNIARVTLTDAASVNAYDILRFKKIIISQRGFERILARIQN